MLVSKAAKYLRSLSWCLALLLENEDLVNKVLMRGDDWSGFDVQMKIQKDVARLNYGLEISQLLKIGSFPHVVMQPH
jgi:hypothetical protein